MHRKTISIHGYGDGSYAHLDRTITMNITLNKNLGSFTINSTTSAAAENAPHTRLEYYIKDNFGNTYVNEDTGYVQNTSFPTGKNTSVSGNFTVQQLTNLRLILYMRMKVTYEDFNAGSNGAPSVNYIMEIDEPSEKYVTVYYHANGADRVKGEAFSGDIADSQSYDLTWINPDGLYNYAKTGALTMQRTGYNPTGYWNSQANGTGISISEDEKINGDDLVSRFNLSLDSNYRATLHLYAQWTAKTPFYITYNANGGTGAPATQTGYEGEVIRVSSTSPTRNDAYVNGYTVLFNANEGKVNINSITAKNTIEYDFSHWNTSIEGTGSNYYAGDYLYSSCTLYAQWNTTVKEYGTVTLPDASKNNDINSIIVTFNANGGETTISSATSIKTIEYSLKGWYTSSSGGTYRGNSGTEYTPSKNETLYAQFSDTFNCTSITLPTKEQCKKSGYTLLGFSINQTATSATYAPGTIYTPSNNVTLYAIWEQNPKQNVYILKDGSFYARSFNQSSEMRISNDGDVYAPTFTTGATFSFNKNGFIATQFIEGVPN